MARPVAAGDLWERVGADHAQRLLVVVGINDFDRRKSVEVAQRGQAGSRLGLVGARVQVGDPPDPHQRDAEG